MSSEWNILAFGGVGGTVAFARKRTTVKGGGGVLLLPLLLLLLAVPPWASSAHAAWDARVVCSFRIASCISCTSAVRTWWSPAAPSMMATVMLTMIAPYLCW